MLMVQLGQSKPCVKQTAFFGPKSSTNYTELFVDEDDTTRIISMKYCVMKSGSVWQHFRGFEATVQSATQTYVQTYGTLDAGGDKCETFNMGAEEIVDIVIYSDRNDVESLVFKGHLGTTWTMRANGASNNAFKMLGRPIGFGMYMGYGGTANQPLKMSIMYNGCNCPASYFTGTQQPRDLVTKAVAGPADDYSLVYQENYMEAIYGQNCGSYTVELFPNYSFITLSKTTGTTGGPNNLAFWDNIKLESNNPIDIGQYEILMTVTQDTAQGDGFTDPFIGSLPSISYTFKATVNPCSTSYAAVTKTTTITYTIGSASLTSSAYSFIQTPDCGYTDFVTLTNLPSFAVHKKATKDFTVVKTENRGLAGTTTVTIKGYISEPDDYLTQTFTDKSVTYTFDIVMVDPCASTVIDAYAIADMSTAAFGTPDIQTLAIPLDSVGKLYGDKSGRTYCGGKTVTITGASPAAPAWNQYLVLDTTQVPKFTAQTSTPSHQGTYTITIDIIMDDYTTNKLTVTFKVDILACQVPKPMNPNTAVTAATIKYVLYTAKISFSWNDADWVITPCTYLLDYTFKLKNVATAAEQALNVAGLITKTNGDRTFEVYSTTPANVGNWQVIVTGTTPVGKMNPQYSEDLVFPLQITNDCLNDVTMKTLVPTIADGTFYLGKSTKAEFTYAPTWDSGIGCPFTYEMRRVVGGVDQVFTATETALITLNAADGSFDIYTVDKSLHAQVWTLKVFKKSTYSNQPSGTYTFQISFLDECVVAVLTAPVPAQLTNTFDLYQAEIISASQMTNGGLSCGGFTYELEYLSGPAKDAGINHLTIYTLTDIGTTITQTTTHGNPAAKVWIGEHQFRLKGTNGQVPTRLYSSVYSVPWTVTIVDPCLRSVLNSDNGAKIGDISSPALTWTLPGGSPGTIDATTGAIAEWTTPVLNGPKDEIAITYGNGYDLCGYLDYSWLQSDGQTPFKNSGIIEVNASKSQFAMDTFTFTVQNYVGGYVWSKEIILRLNLLAYPTAKIGLLPIKVKYGICRPSQFKIWPLEDKTYQIGENTQLVKYELDQAPCGHEISQYHCVNVISGTSEASLPAFIRSAPDTTPMIWFDTDDAADVGTYIIRCYGSLMHEGLLVDSISTDFKVNVLPVVKRVSPNDTPTAPVWELGLEDQTIYVYENLLYPVTLKETPWGQDMVVKTDLGSTKDFLDWDDAAKVFKVHEYAALELYVGSHIVCMEVAFYNSTYREEYNDCFVLTILTNKTIEENVTWVPPEKVVQQPVKQFIHTEYGLELGPYNPRQPIPYIADLSVTGMLTIGWDRSMTPRDDYEKIGPARVAIQNASDIEAAQSQEVNLGEATVLAGPNGRRQLVYRHEGLYTDQETQEEQWLLIVEALELRMNAGEYSEETKLNFTWAMQGFSQERISIQLYFNYPERVSEYVEFDILEIYFWGVDWFQSDKGETVRYGSKLARPILRQIDPTLAEWLGAFGHIMMLLSSLIMLVAAMSTGRVLPSWIFLEALQLMSHLPLFKTSLPAPAGYFMSKFLELSRFNLLWPMLKDFAGQNGRFREGALNMTFEAYGYASMYHSGNMPMLILTAIVIAVCILLGFVKLYFMKNTPVREIVLKNNHFSWMLNFALRFYLEVFLIICMSSLIALSKTRQENLIPEYNEPHDSDASHSSYDIVLAAFLIMLIILTVLAVLINVGYSVLVNFREKEFELQGSNEKTAQREGCLSYLLGQSKNQRSKQNHSRSYMESKLDDSDAQPLKFLNKNKLEEDYSKLQALKLKQAAQDFIDAKKMRQVQQANEQYENTTIMPKSAVLSNEKSKSRSQDISHLSVSSQSVPSPRHLEKQERKNTTEYNNLNRDHMQPSSDDRSESDTSSVNGHEKDGNNFLAPFEQSARRDHNAQFQDNTEVMKIEEQTTTHLSALNMIENLKKRNQQYHEGGEEIKFNHKIEELFWDQDQRNDYDKHLKEQHARVHEQAQKNVAAERQRQHNWAAKHQMTRTLGYGHSNGIRGYITSIYWLVFILRRLAFAILLVYLYDSPSLGISTFLIFSMANLSILSLSTLWDQSWIGIQHFTNECFLTLLALILMVVSNGFILTWDSVDNAGIIVIALVIAFIVFNWVIIIYDICLLLRLHLIRARGIIEHRSTRFTIRQINKITEKAQEYQIDLALNGQFTKHQERTEMFGKSKKIMVETNETKKNILNLDGGYSEQMEPTDQLNTIVNNIELLIGVSPLEETKKPPTINDEPPIVLTVKTKPLREKIGQDFMSVAPAPMHEKIPSIMAQAKPKRQIELDYFQQPQMMTIGLDSEKLESHLMTIEEDFVEQDKLEEQFVDNKSHHRLNSRTQHFLMLNNLQQEHRDKTLLNMPAKSPNGDFIMQQFINARKTQNEIATFTEDQPEQSTISVPLPYDQSRNTSNFNRDIHARNLNDDLDSVAQTMTPQIEAYGSFIQLNKAGLKQPLAQIYAKRKQAPMKGDSMYGTEYYKRSNSQTSGFAIPQPSQSLN